MAILPTKCSTCDVSAQVVFEENTPQKVICPKCGAYESYKDFQLSVGHQTKAYASKKIGKALGDNAKSNRNFTYTPGKISSHHPNFRVEFSE